MMAPTVQNGALDGRVILRFAHAFESGGGTERYLDDLDYTLLKRNAATVIRLHLTRQAPCRKPVEERIGQGRLIRTPLPIVPPREASGPSSEPGLGYRLKQMARERVLYHPIVWRAFGSRWTSQLQIPLHPGQAIGAGSAAAEFLRQGPIDLVMLHFFGGGDADELVQFARTAGLPFAVLNHYSNDRFLHLTMRKHTMLASGVAGVNALEVPAYAQKGFANLSDGIDTEFFQRKHARPISEAPAQPIVLLPARVVREKGQMDLVRAAARLRQSGVECCLAFAGRVDASGFVDELRKEIAQAGLTERVKFLGDLDVETLRDWYAAAAVVAFPTYHHEGLGRVIVEAQAMQTPVVAYATGGVPEGIESGKTGYLLRTGDFDGLAARLRELLSSPDRAASLGANGREAAETRFSLASLAERHERFYNRVIGDFSAARAKVSAS